MSSIQIAPDAEAVALASMVADVVESNLEAHPERIKIFNRMKGDIGIEASEAQVGITMAFRGGECVFHDEMGPACKLRIRADTDTLMEVTNLNIKFGIPWLFDETGISIVRHLLKRELKVGGILIHPLMLIQLLIVLSVM